MRYLAALLIASTIYATPVSASDEEVWPAEDLLHSDLPLFTENEKDKLWPRSYRDPDPLTIGGYESRVQFGDWRLSSTSEQEGVLGWYRFSNYGAMHCYASLRQTDERANLAQSNWEMMLFVHLSEIRIAGRRIELWAAQIGFRPGSEYLLFSRERGEPTIERFIMLQRRCPRGNVRDAGQIDIALTRYCAINSKQELVALAKRMAKLPPIGVLEWVGKEEGPDDVTSGPS